jgi:hypothetical protein
MRLTLPLAFFVTAALGQRDPLALAGFVADPSGAPVAGDFRFEQLAAGLLREVESSGRPSKPERAWQRVARPPLVPRVPVWARSPRRVRLSLRFEF